jgi:hypothetical protein
VPAAQSPSNKRPPRKSLKLVFSTALIREKVLAAGGVTKGIEPKYGFQEPPDIINFNGPSVQ